MRISHSVSAKSKALAVSVWLQSIHASNVSVRKRRSGDAPAPRSSSALPSNSVAAVPMMPSCSVISRAYTHAPGGLGRWHRYSSRSRHSPE